jgi:hypothetical protein
VTVQFRLEDGAIVARLGPFSTERLRAELGRDDAADGVTLRRVLDTVVDRYELDADGWLELTKAVELQKGVA